MIKNLNDYEKTNLDLGLRVICQHNINKEGKGVEIGKEFISRDALWISVYECNEGVFIRLKQQLLTKEFSQSNGYRRYGTKGIDYITITEELYKWSADDNSIVEAGFIPSHAKEIDDLGELWYGDEGEYEGKLYSWLDALKIPNKGDERYVIEAEHGRIYSHDYLQEIDVDSYTLVEEVYEGDGEWSRMDVVCDWFIKDNKEYIMNENEEYDFTNGSWWEGTFEEEDEAREYMQKEILTL